MNTQNVVRVVDLTRPFGQGFPGFDKKIAKELSADGWNASSLNFYSHAGTHMDAPVHFLADGATLEHYPPGRFLSQAWVVDVTWVNEKSIIDIAHLGDASRYHKPGQSLLLKTGWSSRFGRPEYRESLPRIAPSLAHWCVDRKVNLLGVEPPSVADVQNLAEVTVIHQILLEGGVIPLEGLVNLDQLSTSKVFLIALPLLIEGGDGAPARVIALETPESANDFPYYLPA